MRQLNTWPGKLGFVTLIAGSILALAPSRANAQYANYFYYRNPQTGATYSFGGAYSNGYRNYTGGVGYAASNGRYYSNYSGWSGGPGNRHYLGGNAYGTPNYGYGNRWVW
jgi:hypothetical protein